MGSNCHFLPPISTSRGPRGIKYADELYVLHILSRSIKLKGFTYRKFVKSSLCFCHHSETLLFLRMVITPSRPEMQTQPWPQLCAILSKSSYFVTNANPFANKLIKASMFASRGDSWSSPVTAGEERSGSELTKTIKYSSRHLARIRTDFLDRLEAKNESSPAKERYNWSQGLGVTRQLFSVVL